MRDLRHKCLFCEWWDGQEVPHSNLGYCRVEPPSASSFPLTTRGDYCARFREFRHPDLTQLLQVVESNDWALMREDLYGGSCSYKKALLNQTWVDGMELMI